MTAVLTRPSYRPYVAEVARIARLSPHFVRITFTGPDLDVFGTAGLDQRVKLLLPGSDGVVSDVGQRDPHAIDAGTWYDTWRALPHETRSVFRTYTVRRIDPAARELDIDFVLHHEPGPAGAWASGCAVGDEIVVVGPDERSPDSGVGLDWHPGSARRVLLAGDETAAPAICSILETLGAQFEADAYIEVPTDRDVLPLACHARVQWIVRDEREHGAALIEAVSEWADAEPDTLARAASPRPQELDELDVDDEMLWDSPVDSDGEFYAWMAGESATVKTLRRLLVQGHGVDRKRVAFMGYWRAGRAERME